MTRNIVVRGKRYVVKRSEKKNKDYKIILGSGKQIHFGDPDSRLGVNNPKRRKSYCARSSGIKSKSAYSPNALSRKMWRC